jgi:tRNA dimethylallyltransferase
MNIGTAKASSFERSKIHHWLIDIIDPSEAYSVYRFFDDASDILRKLKQHNRVGLVCGGTGLYLRGLLEGIGPQEQSDLSLRDQLTLRAQQEGCLSLHNELRLKDPVSAEKFHANDVQRVIRALSVFYQTGIPISELHKTSTKQKEFEFVVVKITSDRDKLYEKINNRVDRMVENGLYDEFRSLLSRGYDETSPGMHCVGYKEFFAVEKNEYSFKMAVELIKRNTRRFAKRQITWFSHQQFGFEIDLNEVGVNWKEKIKKVFLDNTSC